MPTASPLQLFPTAPASARTLAAAVAAVGTERFGASLLNHLHETCAADYCAVFQLGTQAPSELTTGSHDGSQTARERVSRYLQLQGWSRDPAMVFARTRLPATQPMMMRVDVTHLPDQALRDSIWPGIRDRIVLAGRSAGTHRAPAAFSISILRESRGAFSDTEIQRVGASAEVLIALLARHAELHGVASSPHGTTLTNVPAIEYRLQALSPLTRRERQVCARILSGWPTPRIAEDLGLRPETIKTFRKLAYRRLDVGSEHALLTWYLDLQQPWNLLGGGPHTTQ